MGRVGLILPDSSAWIEHFRRTGNPTHLRMRELLESDGQPLATTDVIMMELLAGARSNAHRDELRRLFYGCEYLRTQAPADFEAAAEVWRICRRNGETIRKQPDCLIAVVAMRTGAAVLARDGDFPAIARHLPLDLA